MPCRRRCSKSGTAAIKAAGAGAGLAPVTVGLAGSFFGAGFWSPSSADRDEPVTAQAASIRQASTRDDRLDVDVVEQEGSRARAGGRVAGRCIFFFPAPGLEQRGRV